MQADLKLLRANLGKTLRTKRNYRIPLSAPASVEAMNSTIMAITKIFLVEDFILIHFPEVCCQDIFAFEFGLYEFRI